jgi:hypothetical protein
VLDLVEPGRVRIEDTAREAVVEAEVLGAVRE